MDLTKLKKLESAGKQQQHQQLSTDDLVTGIVKVRKPGYRPAGIKVRSEIAPTMFTAEFLASDLPTLENDPDVETVSLNQRLPVQKTF
jgi:hypothetical protein